MVPLPPGDRVGSVVGRPDIERPGEFAPVQIKRYLPSSIRSVQKVDGVDTRLLDVDRHVEPLSRHRPPDIKQVLGRMHLLVRIVVDLIVIFGIGGIHAFAHAELIQVSPIGWGQTAAAVVFGIAVVVGNPFTA